MRRVRPPQTAAPAQELPLPPGEGWGEGEAQAILALPRLPQERRVRAAAPDSALADCNHDLPRRAPRREGAVGVGQ